MEVRCCKLLKIICYFHYFLALGYSWNIFESRNTWILVSISEIFRKWSEPGKGPWTLWKFSEISRTSLADLHRALLTISLAILRERFVTKFIISILQFYFAGHVTCSASQGNQAWRSLWIQVCEVSCLTVVMNLIKNFPVNDPFHYVGRHATLHPSGKKHCVTTQIMAPKETTSSVVCRF